MANIGVIIWAPFWFKKRGGQISYQWVFRTEVSGHTTNLKFRKKMECAKRPKFQAFYNLEQTLPNPI